jgi:hypothetical protein
MIDRLADVSEALEAYAIGLRQLPDPGEIRHDLSIRRYDPGTLSVEGYVDRRGPDGLSRVWWVEACRRPKEAMWTVRASVRTNDGTHEEVLTEADAHDVREDRVAETLLRLTREILEFG